jgi:hypothetical protein
LLYPRAVTIAEEPPALGVRLDRILQMFVSHRRTPSARVLTHDDMVAFPAGFLCARRKARGGGSFWHNGIVRGVRFCDAESHLRLSRQPEG